MDVVVLQIQVLRRGNNKTCESYVGNTDHSIGLKILNSDGNKYEICQSVPFKKQLPDFQNFADDDC